MLILKKRKIILYSVDFCWSRIQFRVNVQLLLPLHCIVLWTGAAYQRGYIHCAKGWHMKVVLKKLGCMGDVTQYEHFVNILDWSENCIMGACRFRFFFGKTLILKGGQWTPIPNFLCGGFLQNISLLSQYLKPNAACRSPLEIRSTVRVLFLEKKISFLTIRLCMNVVLKFFYRNK